MRSLQSDIEQRGACIFELVDKHPERFFSKAGFYQRLMALSMHDERFKTQLFRFVAVLPSACLARRDTGSFLASDAVMAAQPLIARI